MTELRTVRVAGATGLIGGHLVKLLLAGPACDKAVVLARRPLHQGKTAARAKKGAAPSGQAGPHARTYDAMRRFAGV